MPTDPPTRLCMLYIHSFVLRLLTDILQVMNVRRPGNKVCMHMDKRVLHASHQSPLDMYAPLSSVSGSALGHRYNALHMVLYAKACLLIPRAFWSIAIYMIGSILVHSCLAQCFCKMGMVLAAIVCHAILTTNLEYMIRVSYRILSWGGKQDGSRMIVACVSVCGY